jgi:hypothetical protein
VSAFLLVLWWAWLVIGLLSLCGMSWEAKQSRLAAGTASRPPRRKQTPTGLSLVTDERYQETVWL